MFMSLHLNYFNIHLKWNWVPSCRFDGAALLKGHVGPGSLSLLQDTVDCLSESVCCRLVQSPRCCFRGSDDFMVGDLFRAGRPSVR